MSGRGRLKGILASERSVAAGPKQLGYTVMRTLIGTVSDICTRADTLCFVLQHCTQRLLCACVDFHSCVNARCAAANMHSDTCAACSFAHYCWRFACDGCIAPLVCTYLLSLLCCPRLPRTRCRRRSMWKLPVIVVTQLSIVGSERKGNSWHTMNVNHTRTNNIQRHA